MNVQTVFVPLFDENEMSAIASGYTSEQKGALKGLLSTQPDSIRIRKRTSQEMLVMLEQEMHDKFRNFHEVIDELFSQMKLSAMSTSKGIHFRPILLVGPPGVGKSFFAKTLADTLLLPFVKFDFATASTSMHLSGSSARWGNSGPGIIAKTLIKQPVVNPIVFIDELEKARTSGVSSGGSTNVLASLIQLLEIHSAREFVDEYLEFPIDASHINYIAAANSTDGLPDYILSRFTVVRVSALTREEVITLLPSVFAQVIEELELPWTFDEALTDDVLDCIPNLEIDVRELRKYVMFVLESMIGRASQYVETEDMMSAAKKLSDRREKVMDKKRTIGFI